MPSKNSHSEHKSIPHSRRSGFTLVEILVVIVIISILAGIVVVTVISRPGEARIAAARLQIKQLQTALQMYHNDQGRFPSQEQGLEALVRKPDIGLIPENYPAYGYLESQEVPRDPWKKEFIYLSPGSSGEPYEILCYGSDGEPGGESDAGDISSARLN